MEDIILHYGIWGGIILFIVFIAAVYNNEFDIKTVVWLRLWGSIFIMIVGNLIMFTFYKSSDSGPAYELIGILLITYACIDIPTKVAGVYYKRKLNIEDFSINPFDKQIEKLGVKPMLLTLLLIVSQVFGCSKMNEHYNDTLREHGIDIQAIVKDKRYERINKRTYDTVAYLEFEHKNRLYELTTLCPNLQLGSTSIIRIDPSNVGNCKLKNNDGSFYHVLSIKCIKVDISDSVKIDSLYRQILRDIN